MAKILIIAEAGVNHNGSLQIAKKMIEVAQQSGADIIKFQTFKTEKLVSRTLGKAEYQQRTTGVNESQFDMIKKLELSESDHIELLEYCKLLGIEFLSTPFDLESIDFLSGLGIETWKVPSGEITNLPLLRKIAGKNGKVILSTGMASLGEIESALDVLHQGGVDPQKIVVLHCTTEYPAPFAEVNLRAMQNMATTFNVQVGYSDHTQGIVIPIAAAALGATVIEKHFTLDRTMDGPDHKASLEPLELKQMVEGIRCVELALGNGVKHPSESELKNKLIARKCIVAATPINVGEVFSESNLTVKRAGTGISPMEWDSVIGRVARKTYCEDEPITW